MNLTGHIIDKDTKDPLPGATVELWYGNVMLNRSGADANGYFSITSSSSPENIVVTNASYKKGTFPYIDNVRSVSFGLEKNIVEGEPVIVTSILKGKTSWVVWGIGLLLLLLAKKRT